MQKKFFLLIAALVVIALACYSGFSVKSMKKDQADSSVENAQLNKEPEKDPVVELAKNQLENIKVEPVGSHSFNIEKEVVGNVAYHDKNPHVKSIIANVPESDSPTIHVGQLVKAKVISYPNQTFHGRISVVGVNVYDTGDGNPAVDPNTHRTSVRCQIDDPKNELYPGMFANVAIQIHQPIKSTALPENGVVREGDGSMSVWVTTDNQHFTRRVVKVGLRQDGYAQITEGLEPGELAATDGAIFISNMYYALPTE